jgi:hypothetical protein
LSPQRKVVRELLPGIVLPGLIYLVVSRSAPVIVALAAASSVPALDALVKLVRGRSPSFFGLCFILFTGLSVGLAAWFHSPLIILLKGAVVSAVMGMAFSVSAALRRPLTRFLAVRLTSDHAEGRRHLLERWGHPKALKIFCVLSIGWGILLLVTSLQQFALALTASPGLVIAVEAPLQAGLTGVGIVVSIVYVRRHQRNHPELALIPARVA